MHSLGGFLGRERGPTPAQGQCSSHQITPARGAGGRPGELEDQAGDAKSVNRVSRALEVGSLGCRLPWKPHGSRYESRRHVWLLGFITLKQHENPAPRLHRPRFGGSAASCGCWLLCQAAKMEAVLQYGARQDPSPGKIPSSTENAVTA